MGELKLFLREELRTWDSSCKISKENKVSKATLRLRTKFKVCQIKRSFLTTKRIRPSKKLPKPLTKSKERLRTESNNLPQRSKSLDT